MQKFTRESLAVVTLAALLGAVIPWTSAQEKTSGDHMAMHGDSMKMSPEDMKMASQQMDQMKMKAADQPQEMAADMAKLMVMDKMAVQMAMDPSFTKMLRQNMADPKMKQVREGARNMADDPAEMAKIRQEIMADPNAMHMVVHQAAVMSMMHDGMMHQGMMKDDKMKEMPAEKK
jgi:hypothetical protein